MTDGNGEATTRWQRWVTDGKVATVAWFIVTGVYVTFRYQGINDSAMTNAFTVLTGFWVASLGIVQSRKNARIELKAAAAELKAELAEQKAVSAEQKVEVAEQKVEHLEQVAVKHHPEERKGLGSGK